MKKLLILVGVVAVMAMLNRVHAADGPSLDPHLEIFRPLLGKTWRGEFVGSKPEQPIVDIMRWERALNGNAIRVLHSINDGVYGGEILILWDAAQNTVAYHYFTTAGFTTDGTMKSDGTKFVGHEMVKGSADGATEVRSTNELLPNGTFHVKSEYKKNGEWGPGHEATYREDKNAEVRFK